MNTGEDLKKQREAVDHPLLPFSASSPLTLVVTLSRRRQ